MTTLPFNKLLVIKSGLSLIFIEGSILLLPRYLFNSLISVIPSTSILFNLFNISLINDLSVISSIYKTLVNTLVYLPK